MIEKCQRCGNEIPAERLEILPDTVICVACSKDIGGEYTVKVVEENVAKAGSLKKNYGSYGISKVRKPIERKA